MEDKGQQFSRPIDRLAFNVTEAALVAGFGRNTIYNEVAAGRLVARKFGRRTVISRADLETWINSLPQMAA